MLWIKHLREEIRKGLLVTLMLHRCLVAKLCPTLYNPMNCSTPPLYPRVCSNSCPLSSWHGLTISSSGASFSFCLQSLPATGSFPVSQLFALHGQRIGASASVLPMNIQSWFPLGLTGLISLQSKGLSRIFFSITVQKHQFFSALAFFMVQLSHPYMTTGKTIALTIQKKLYFVGSDVCSFKYTV